MAVKMMEELEDQLVDLHNCRLKDNERKVIRAACRRYEPYDIPGTMGRIWTCEPDLRILGPTVSCTGAPGDDVDDSLARVSVACLTDRLVKKV